MRHVSVDQQRLERTVQEFGARWTRDAADIETYLAAQVSDASHREVVGPLRAASGASGVVRVGGREVAAWGDPDVPEMAFIVTKLVVSVVAGLAFDDGLLVPDQPVHQVVDVPEFRGPHNGADHLASSAAAVEPVGGRAVGQAETSTQSFRERTEVHGIPRARGGRTTTCG